VSTVLSNPCLDVDSLSVLIDRLRSISSPALWEMLNLLLFYLQSLTYTDTTSQLDVSIAQLAVLQTEPGPARVIQSAMDSDQELSDLATRSAQFQQLREKSGTLLRQMVQRVLDGHNKRLGAAASADNTLRELQHSQLTAKLLSDSVAEVSKRHEAVYASYVSETNKTAETERASQEQRRREFHLMLDRIRALRTEALESKAQHYRRQQQLLEARTVRTANQNCALN
jgi:hypothetical protein